MNKVCNLLNVLPLEINVCYNLIMINDKDLIAEKKYLNETFCEIQKQKNKSESALNVLKNNLKEQIEYSVNSFYEMDDEEIAATKTILENQELEIIKQKEKINKFNLLKRSAYFGRIDFNSSPYYIGVSSLIDENERLYISDWRAPISSLYYDYELGEAKYLAPSGEIEGKISKKRQYKIQKNDLIYAFDSSLTINDEILKETLSAESTYKLKNIVSTIQKEQNKIIRANESGNLLIQGEAGSGKTSIALHRAAYLLYKKVGKLTANDIMVISPNKLFSEYISNILPELGERNIIETTFNGLASKELPKIKILNRDESVNISLSNIKFAKNILYKNSFEFFEKLKKFLIKFSNFNFKAQDIKLGAKTIKKEIIEELYYSKYQSKKVSIRFGWIADFVIDELQLPKKLYRRVLKVVYYMFSKKAMVEIYNEFLKSENIECDFNRKVYFEDAPAILYIKDYILGLENKQKIKYLLIDEMQDYNYIHYDIFNKLFDCPKLILGDINQNIFDIYNYEDLIKLNNLIGDCELIKLSKSYRSTYEISKYCQKIKNIKYDVINRHGEPVHTLKINSKLEEINKIVEIFSENKDKRIALICKTREEASKYFELIKDRLDVILIDSDLNIIGDKLVLSSTNAKGIEFDVVIIPNFSKNNYSTKIDKNILYISATRALHRLYILQN